MNFKNDDILNCLGSDKSDVLFIVPPFSLLEMPCIGVDILKSIAKSMNITASVLYGNLIFAKYIGVDKYKIISRGLMSMHTMLGERIFANAANKSIPTLGFNFLKNYDENFNDIFFQLSSVDEICQIAKLANKWCDILAEKIVDKGFKIIGITTGHQQTNAAISLINRIKERNQNIICIMGGSACDGEMAEGILSLCPTVDYIFSGESEMSWRKFLTKYKNNVLPDNKIIRSEFIQDLDEISFNENSYNDYFRQLKVLKILDESNTSFLYESSRGCWWGEHHKCYFCGVNGWEKKYRQKSEQKVKSDLTKMLKAHPNVKRVQMVDTLMPNNYHKKLISSIKKDFPYLLLFYEQRANLNLEQVKNLKLCGVNYTQVGIEALSTDLLKVINKGITARQNIEFLRYAKSVGLLIGWNLLTGIPNDKIENWSIFFNLIPMIYHLNPPILIRPLEIVRFSPYYENPMEYKIKDIKPKDVYYDIFSNNADIDSVAWVFSANYNSDSKNNIELSHRIRSEVQKWMAMWKRGKENIPTLYIYRKNSKYYLEDSRFGPLSVEQITPNQAKVALFGVTKALNSKDVDWGLKKKVLYLYEGKYLPLATSHPQIFDELNHECIS